MYYLTWHSGRKWQKYWPKTQCPVKATYGVTGTAVMHMMMSDTAMLTKYIRVLAHR